MITAGTYCYQPSAGTGGFLSDAYLLCNPPFSIMGNNTAILDWVLANRHGYQNCQLIDLLELAKMWTAGEIGPDRPLPAMVLQERWRVCRSEVKIRLYELQSAGLIAFASGTTQAPGYRISRVGPLGLGLGLGAESSSRAKGA